MPLEEQINGVEGMIYMSSISDNEGQSSITITFEVGYDVNTAQVDVLNNIQAALPRLPDIVQRAGVVVVKQTPAILLAVNLVSPDETFDGAFLNNYVQIHIVDPLNRLPGTGNRRSSGCGTSPARAQPGHSRRFLPSGRAHHTAR